MINFNSGIIDITLKTLNTLNNLKKKKLLGIGINETKTIKDKIVNALNMMINKTEY